MSEGGYDTVFCNAKVVTLDPGMPDASLVAVRDGRVALVSRLEMQEGLKGKAGRIVDCAGRTLIPGFVDAHCHLVAYAENLISLSLSPRNGIRSVSDIREKIRDACARASPGEWVRGKSYNEFYLSEKRHPNRRDLDRVAPSNPVKLTHRSGHAHVLNSLALEKAGIGDETGDPPGGMIDRDPDTGLPTGLLFGMGGYLSGRIPGLDEAGIENGLKRANEKLLSCGITSVQDASSCNGLKQWQKYESWKQRGLFAPGLSMMLGLRAFADFNEKDYVTRVPDGELKLGAVKIVVNRVTGSLDPGSEELGKIIASIHTKGFQAAIHAVEEPVIAACVAGLARALRLGPEADARHRIEHCSVCRPGLLRKMADLGIMAVTQPAFLNYEGDRYLETVRAGDLENLYPVGAMLENGVGTGFGSDFPVADPNPWVGISAAVTRRTETGRRMPGPCIDLKQALAMHIYGGAAANFEERVRGSVRSGKKADLVLLNRDPFSVPPCEIKDIRAVMTVLGGKIVWPDK
ncbi:MAG: amidohydrolase [Acidobacteria bacterium]|nr:amidohydrolase [Acidobacteriota bacterium]